ncbi:hypothetical protein BGX31_011274 [Mortierella sp. GBA43]|nr:hypothetical protein BGX31_011274 [Mortierella sp. GBA43]
MIFLAVSALTLFATVAYAQPQDVPARSTRAITLVGDTIFLYGGSGSDGNCFSDLYSLRLDPTNGWMAASAPWLNIENKATNAPVLGTNSWGVGSSDGKSLLFYGQTLCPQQLSTDSNSEHTFTSTSASVEFQSEIITWSQKATENNVLGPRQVKNDEPVPVQVVDTQNHMVYTFVYDAFNPQLGVQLWSFSTDHLPTNIAASAKNTTMLTTRPPTPAPPPPPPPPTNGTNATVPVPPPAPQPKPVVLAPFVDVGSAIYLNGTIVVIGGGRPAKQNVTSDDLDPISGWNKMDRCWVYTIATNEWSVRNLTTHNGKFPSPRRLAALLVVESRIYMHGGNTTDTVSTSSYATDFWILDTQTWQWTNEASSSAGRASHTLVRYQDSLVSLSGFEFATSKTRAASSGMVMVYDLKTMSWGSQFGVINKTFFQQHTVAIIGGTVAGFILLLVIASVLARLWRKYTRGPLPSRPSAAVGGGINRNRPNKTSIASKRRSNRTSNPTPDAVAAASHLSDVTVTQQHDQYETKIDLATLPRANEQYQYSQQQTFNPYASTNQQQRVPLMSANALEQQSQDFSTYADDDEIHEKDMRPVHHSPPPSLGAAGSGSRSGSFSHQGQSVVASQGGSRSGSFSYQGQSAAPSLPFVPTHGTMSPGAMTPGSRNQSPPRG